MTDIGNRDGKPVTEKASVEKASVEEVGSGLPKGGKQADAPAVPPPSIALLPQDERDKLTLRLQHAVTGFVDGPQESFEEADRVLEEVAERFTEAVARSRRTVRATLQSSSGTDSGHTERLRLALRDYRELAERLLHA